MPLGNIPANASGFGIDTVAEATADLEAWQTPTMLNGWVASTSPPLSFYKDPSNFVHFRGYVNSSGVGAAQAFVLPAGYRPTEQTRYPLYLGASTTLPFAPTNGYVTINPDGTVVFSNFGVIAGTTVSTEWHMNSISFRATNPKTQLPGTGSVAANQALFTSNSVPTFGLPTLLGTTQSGWSNFISGYQDGFNRVQLMGTLTSMASNAVNSVAVAMSGDILQAPQQFVCAATGMPGGQPFATVLIDGGIRAGQIVIREATQSGSTVSLNSIQYELFPYTFDTSSTWGASPANDTFFALGFQPTNWTAMTGVASTQAPYQTPAWRHDGRGRIQLRGAATYAAGTGNIASVPAAIAPPVEIAFHTPNTHWWNQTPIRFAWMRLGTNGSFFTYYGNNSNGGYVNFDGLSYRLW